MGLFVEIFSLHRTELCLSYLVFKTFLPLIYRRYLVRNNCDLINACLSYYVDFPAVRVVKNPPASAGDVRDMGSVPGLERSPGEGYDNPLQYSWLENLMDREA